MEVLLAASAGFCFGVRRAVEKALAIAQKAQGAVYTDGPLIHNPGMLEELATRGVYVTEAPETLSGEATLLIRAHGIPPERRHFLRGLSAKLEDATCPEVARIQGLIRVRVARGGRVLILGDEGHAEVVGLLGHAQGRGIVLSGVEAVQGLPEIEGAVTLVSQTTQDAELFEAVARAVRERFPQVEIVDTVCDATKNRQRELRTLAERADAIVVVGSPTSANTQRLAEIAARYCPAFLMRGVEDVRAEDFRGMRTIGLTAGASTPDATIQAVRERLVSLEEVKEEV